MQPGLIMKACLGKANRALNLALLLALSCAARPCYAEEIAHDAPPVVFNLDYTAEAWAVPSGGVKRGERFMHSLDLVADADLDKTIGWHGARIHVATNYTNGSSVSSDLAGDRQSISSIQTGVETIRLYEAWIEKDLSKKLSVRAGIYDINDEFDVLETGNTFVGSPYSIGSDIAYSGLNGPSTFPTTGLGLLIRWQNDRGWAVRMAATDGVPGSLSHPKSLSLTLNSAEGAFLMAEAQAPIKDGKLLLGAWRYTSEFDKISGGRSSGNHGFYIRGEAKLTSDRDNPDRGLSGFFRIGTASAEFNPFDKFLSGGLTYKGLFPARPKDTLGLAFAQIRTTQTYRAIAASDQAETHIELTYQAPLIKDRVILQPVAQYIIHPNADPMISNALALGLRLSLQLRSN